MKGSEAEKPPGLGAPVRNPEMPKPHQKVDEKGIVRKDPDTGRFYTDIPGNEAAK